MSTVRSCPTVSGHRIQWTIHVPDGAGRLHGRVTCEQPPGADCRLACDNECGLAQTVSGGCDHPRSDIGSCRLASALNSEVAALVEYYNGDQAPVLDGPILIDWDTVHQCFVWTYAQPGDTTTDAPAQADATDDRHNRDLQDEPFVVVASRVISIDEEDL